MTLNGLAYSYITAHEQIFLLGYLMIVPGFLLGLAWPTPGERVSRGPHWLAALALGLALTLTQVVWFAMPAAVGQGLLWPFALVDLVASLIIGALWARLGKARSRDAWGHPNGAILQLLPPLTLFLLLAKSREEDDGGRRMLTNWALPAGVTVVAGIAMVIATQGATRVLEVQLAAAIETGMQEERTATNMLRYQVEAQGLAPVIAEVVTATPYPLEIEPGHRITAMTAQGEEIHVFHEIDMADAEELLPDYRRALISDTCAGQAWLLQSGGIVVRHFARRPDGHEFEVLRIVNGDCIV